MVGDAHFCRLAMPKMDLRLTESTLMTGSKLRFFMLAVTYVILSQVIADTGHAGIVSTTNSPAVWSALVTGVQTEPFENVPSSFAQYASPPGLTRSSINYSIDRTIDTGGRMLEVSPGTYAPTGVLSMQDTPNGEFSNVLITPATPTDAFAVRHASWRGLQVQFTVTFTDSTSEVFAANTTGVTALTVSGATPMSFTGITADMLISSILVETTLTANDAFARGLNIDDFSIADAIPEPTAACLLAVASLIIFGSRATRNVGKRDRVSQQ
jgi:hypothetical protein